MHSGFPSQGWLLRYTLRRKNDKVYDAFHEVRQKLCISAKPKCTVREGTLEHFEEHEKKSGATAKEAPPPKGPLERAMHVFDVDFEEDGPEGPEFKLFEKNALFFHLRTNKWYLCNKKLQCQKLYVVRILDSNNPNEKVTVGKPCPTVEELLGTAGAEAEKKKAEKLSAGAEGPDLEALATGKEEETKIEYKGPDKTPVEEGDMCFQVRTLEGNSHMQKGADIFRVKPEWVNLISENDPIPEMKPSHSGISSTSAAKVVLTATSFLAPAVAAAADVPSSSCGAAGPRPQQPCSSSTSRRHWVRVSPGYRSSWELIDFF